MKTVQITKDGENELATKVLDGITKESWLALTHELVPAGQPAAENPLDPDLPSGREEGIARQVASKLEAMGLDVHMLARQEGRPNVIGRLAGDAGGPTLIINDHLDTYPAGDPSQWTMTGRNPYHPTLHDDKLYARGTSDTRGNLACTLLAVKAIRDAGIRLQGDLLCVYTVDEEKHGRNGAMFLLDECGLKADFEITAEPTGWTAADRRWGMSIAVAHSGNCLLEIQTRGTKSHIWRPDSGVNAISGMTRLIHALEELAFTHEPPGRYGSTAPRACVVRINGGLAGEMQFTADVCTAVLAVVGIIPGMTAQSILADVHELLERLKQRDSALDATVRLFPESLFVPATAELSPETQPVKAVTRAYRRVLGEEPLLYRKNAYCDTIRFSQHGIPSITFGPGEDGWPPINEYIHVEKSVAAARIYALAIMDLLGVSST